MYGKNLTPYLLNAPCVRMLLELFNVKNLFNKNNKLSTCASKQDTSTGS